MGTIKGQHLRLVINDKCVAAAQTCTVHLSVEMQATSSKDDTGSWQKQEPVGLSWDASTDALVIDGIYQAGSGATSQSVQVGGPNPAYIYPTGVSLSPGEGLEVSGAPASTDNLVLRKINASNYTVISSGGKYVNETTAAETVYVACMTNAQTLTWAVYDGNGLLKQGTDYTVNGDKEVVDILVAVLAAAVCDDETAKANLVAALGDNTHFIQAVISFIPSLQKSKKLKSSLIK